MAVAEPSIRFRQGTVEIRGLDASVLPPCCAWDERAACFRAEASRYWEVVLALHRQRIAVADEARAYESFDTGAREHRQARPYQQEALEAWLAAGGRGVVVLPTGAGKSHLAVMAMDSRRRSTLVVAPTLDLVRQWFDQLRRIFPWPAGVVGGGDHNPQPITVTTYDSAYQHMEHLGARYGLVIFDECHHLPGDSYALAARSCLAPFRLGLTATPDRADGRDAWLDELIGPRVYGREITQLAGAWLSEYEVERVLVDLSPQERHEYEQARATYREFVLANGIRMASPTGWLDFLRKAAGSRAGQDALAAWRRQKHLAQAAPSKLDLVEELLERHRADRTIVFTAFNDVAYLLARRLLVPCITHQTRPTERSAILEALAEGRVRAVITSRVLNEGVDVPAANVAIVVSGSGSVREHVQRLGRVLRKQEGKRALLYELVADGTSEAFTSDRRRQHAAYAEPDSWT